MPSFGVVRTHSWPLIILGGTALYFLSPVAAGMLFVVTCDAYLGLSTVYLLLGVVASVLIYGVLVLLFPTLAHGSGLNYPLMLITLVVLAALAPFQRWLGYRLGGYREYRWRRFLLSCAITFGGSLAAIASGPLLRHAAVPDLWPSLVPLGLLMLTGALLRATWKQEPAMDIEQIRQLGAERRRERRVAHPESPGTGSAD